MQRKFHNTFCNRKGFLILDLRFWILDFGFSGAVEVVLFHIFCIWVGCSTSFPCDVHFCRFESGSHLCYNGVEVSVSGFRRIKTLLNDMNVCPVKAVKAAMAAQPLYPNLNLYSKSSLEKCRASGQHWK